MVSVKNASAPVDMVSFLNWVATFPRKFEPSDVTAKPRLMAAATAYVARWEDNPKSQVNPFMMELKSAVLNGRFLTAGQAKGALNVARAQESFRRPRQTALPVATARGKVSVEQARETQSRSLREMMDALPDTSHEDIRDGNAYGDAERDLEWEAYAQQRRAEIEAERGFAAALAHGPQRWTQEGEMERDGRAVYAEEREARFAEEDAAHDRLTSTECDRWLRENPATPASGLSRIANATYTVVFDETTDDRITLRISDPKWMAEGNASGKQQVSYLRGPENTTDYTGVAFMEDGAIRFWRKVSETHSADFLARIRRAVAIIADGDQSELRLAYALRSGRCARCGRELTVPASINRGLGPECASKIDL